MDRKMGESGQKEKHMVDKRQIKEDSEIDSKMDSTDMGNNKKDETDRH